MNQSTDQSIESYIHTKVVVMRDNRSCSEAARAMCENRIGSVVIADDKGHLCGILTDRDLVCGLLAVTSPLEDLPISEVMTGSIFSVDENATVKDVIGLMLENGVRRIPVVEKTEMGKERCIGIITLDDLIANQAIELKDVARIARTQVVRKRRYRHHRARHEERILQTMDRFSDAFQKGLDLDEDATYRVMRHVLGTIVQRIHYTGAAHLIAQLPQVLQNELLEVPAGPDRSMNGHQLLAGVMERLHVTEEGARRYVSRFWTVLCERISPGQAEHVLHQLPQDMQSLLMAST